MKCDKCQFTGPEGQSHHHIVVENGKVVSVEYISGDGYWDRELEKSEYFVEYKDEWLTPKVYQGKSMCELGECDCASNPECICCK
jgi:hypothetical protein